MCKSMFFENLLIKLIFAKLNNNNASKQVKLISQNLEAVCSNHLVKLSNSNHSDFS